MRRFLTTLFLSLGLSALVVSPRAQAQTKTTTPVLRFSLGPPANTLGNNGDLDLDFKDWRFYGPKSAGKWPATFVSIPGPPGKDGVNGTNGTNGINGTNGLNGTCSQSCPTGASGASGASGATGGGPTGASGASGGSGAGGGSGATGSSGGTGSSGASGASGGSGASGASGALGAIAVQQILVTPQQAIIFYSNVDPSVPCQVETSPLKDFSQLDIDVDPAQFSGSNFDNRDGSLVTSPNSRAFVAGFRAAQVNATGQRVSRSQEQATTHYVRINGNGACNPNGPVITSYTTAPLAWGKTDNDPIPTDPAAPGVAAWPQQVGAAPMIDPLTGVKSIPVQLPGDMPAYSASGTAFQAPYDGTSSWTMTGGTFPVSSTGANPAPLILPIVIGSQLNPSFESLGEGYLVSLAAHLTGTSNNADTVCLMMSGVCQSSLLPANFGATATTLTFGGAKGMTDWIPNPRFNQHLAAQRTGSVTVAGNVLTGPPGTFAPPYAAGMPITLNGSGCSNQVFLLIGDATDSDAQVMVSASPGCPTASFMLNPFALAIFPAGVQQSPPPTSTGRSITRLNRILRRCSKPPTQPVVRP